MKKYIWKIRYFVLLSFFLFTAETICFSVMLSLPGKLIDTDVTSNGVISMFIGYLMVFLLYLLICYFSNRTGDYRRVIFEKNLKNDFFSSSMKRSRKQFKDYEIGEYISMQTNDITEMCQNYLSPLISIYRSVVMILIFGFYLVYYVNTEIAIAIIAFSFLATLFPKITEKELSKRNSRYYDSLGGYTSNIKSYYEIHDSLDKKGINGLIKQNSRSLENLFNENMKYRKINSLAYVLNGGSIEFVSVVSFLFIGLLFVNGAITTGMATTAFLYSNKFNEPFYELNTNIGCIKSIKEIKSKLISIMSYKEDVKEKKTKFEKINLLGLSIDYENKSIKIPNYVIVGNNKYLIEGDNGSGKTTLIRCILGELNYNGKILLDNENINEYDIDDIIAYCPQSSCIIDSNYLDNTTVFGVYDQEKLRNIENLFPSETILNIKKNISSKNLSSGEKQIIAIIRTLLMDKEIYIFDEPFANLNAEVIDYFMQYLPKINKTILIVAHNLTNYHDLFDGLILFGKRED